MGKRTDWVLGGRDQLPTKNHLEKQCFAMVARLFLRPLGGTLPRMGDLPPENPATSP